MKARSAILFYVAWLVCQAGLARANDYAIACSRLVDGHWQIWELTTTPRAWRPLTASSSDKRGLRVSGAPARLYYRDNQGKLFALDDRHPAQEQAVLPDVEVIKDFDVDAQHGFLVSSYAPNANDNLRIWWFDAQGSEKRLVIGEPYLNEMPRWLSGQQAFLFVKSHRGNSAIFRASLDLNATPKLWHESRDPHTDPAPDPEGQRVAFCREIQGGFDLWIARVDGAQPRSIHAGPGLEAEPAWTPDGQWVLFSTWDGEHFRIARVRPEGSDFEYLSPAGSDARYPVCLATLKGSP